MSDNTSKPGQGSSRPPKQPVPEKPPIITLKTVRITDSVDLTKVKAAVPEDKSE